MRKSLAPRGSGGGQGRENAAAGRGWGEWVDDSTNATLDGASGIVAHNPYDAVGNLKTKTDARNVITCFGTLNGSTCDGLGYDVLNRPVKKSYSDGTPQVTWTYDTSSATCTKGHLISVSNSNSTTNLTPYDCLGRATASSQVTGGQTYTFGYGYNLAGALTSETYPSGRVVAMNFDGANRVSAVSSGTTTYVQSIQYAPHGGETSWLLGSGATGSQQFNPRLEPTSITVGSALSLGFYYCPNGGASCSTNNGNLMRQTIASYPPTFSVIQNYDATPYDGVNRLKSVTEGTLSRSYGYDAWGNRWVSANAPGLFLSTFTPTVSTNFNSLNRLIIQGSTYDNAGNQTVIGGFTMAYNGENLMTSSTIGGVATQYSYDGDNRRVKKVTGTATTVYVYDAGGGLAAEYAPVTDPDPPCRTCYLVQDHLGSTRAMLDEANVLVARYDYLPFGEQIPTGYNGRTALWGAAPAWAGQTADGLTEKFTGKERDAETGLDYFGARYYSGAQGRFTSPDPLGANILRVINPQRRNMYSYGLNNSLMYVDPDGRDAIVVNYSKMAVGMGHQAIISVHADGRATFAEFGPKGFSFPVKWGQHNVRALETKVSLGANGLPTDASYAALIKELAGNEEQPSDSISLAYFKTSDADTAALDSYINWTSSGWSFPYIVDFYDCRAYVLAGLQAAHVNYGSHADLGLAPNFIFDLLAQQAQDVRGEKGKKVDPEPDRKPPHPRKLIPRGPKDEEDQ
jgi:RHS repeat-associated protein